MPHSHSTEPPEAIREPLLAILHAAHRTELAELHTLQEMLAARYGPELAKDALENVDGCVSPRVTRKLAFHMPPPELVDAYMDESTSRGSRSLQGVRCTAPRRTRRCGRGGHGGRERRGRGRRGADGRRRGGRRQGRCAERQGRCVERRRCAERIRHGAYRALGCARRRGGRAVQRAVRLGRAHVAFCGTQAAEIDYCTSYATIGV